MNKREREKLSEAVGYLMAEADGKWEEAMDIIQDLLVADARRRARPGGGKP